MGLFSHFCIEYGLRLAAVPRYVQLHPHGSADVALDRSGEQAHEEADAHCGVHSGVGDAEHAVHAVP